MTQQITYASVCSGIETATAAWHKLQWKAMLFSEIEAFPRAVLTHHYPDVKLVGDFTKLIDDPPDVDVLVGGTSCQDYSMAGLRAGLDGARGNLTLEFIRLANAIDNLRRDRGKHPCVFVWENVPGVFSIKNNGFGNILSDMVGEDTPICAPGNRWTDAGMVIGPGRAAAWRTFDTQFFGLPQRRRRVFIVGSAAEGFDPSAVLLECEGVRRHSPPRRQPRQGTAEATEGGFGSGGESRDVAPTIPSRERGGGGMGTDFDLDGRLIANSLTAGDGKRVARLDDGNLLIAGTLEDTAGRSRGAGTPTSMIVPESPIVMSSGQANAEIRTDGGTPALTCLHEAPIVAQAFKPSHYTRGKDGAPDEVVPPLSADADKGDQDTVVFSIMPMNSNKDFKARPTDVAQPLMAAGPVKGAQGGDYVVQPVEAFNARQESLTYGDMSGPLDTDGYSMAIAFSAKDSGQDAAEDLAPTLRAMHETDGNANGGGQVAIAFEARVARNGRGAPEEIVPPLKAQSGETGKGDAAPLVAILFDTTQLTSKINRSNLKDGDPCHTLAAGANPPALTNGWEVRRLTPTECERLQGFEDGWTDVPYRGRRAADGPRYKSLGNAMSVPVMEFIGGRLQTSLAWLLANPPTPPKKTKKAPAK